VVTIDNQTQLKIDIIAKVNDNKICINEAVKLLNKSKRTIERYLQQYRKEGMLFAIHKNCRRPPVNKTSNEIKIEVQKLIKKKYFDLNLFHLGESQDDHLTLSSRLAQE